MSDQPNTPEGETPDEVALAADTADAAPAQDAAEAPVPDAPAAEVEQTEVKDVEVVEATDAVDDAPEAEEAPAAAVKPTPPARKRDAKPAQPARKPNGKIARDKHGLPITTGPVVQAHAKYVRTSARKARLVCDHIRGKSVEDAVAILAHTPPAVAEDWEKLLKSAVANAEHNHELLGDDLKIHAVFADEGPTLKRFRPRAMGRATKIRKRTSHLTIQLTPKEQ